jgi:CheY-like chemotaxis protein
MHTAALDAPLPTVLVVDDDAFTRDYVRELLVSCGITQVQTATNGRDALTLLSRRSEAPDYLICDVFMPEMDGFEFLEHLGEQHYPGKVILMSGGNNSMLGLASDVALHYGIQLTGFFTKPLAQHSLVRAMGSGAPA